MPDMQTEVKKIISGWTLPEEPPKASKETDKNKSLGEQVYEYIKANPKCTMPSIRKAFNKTDKEDASIASTLKNLYDRKLIGRVAIDNPNFKGYGRRVVFVYWAVANTYEMQVKGLYSKKNKTVKIVAKKAKGVAETERPEKTDTIAVNRPATNVDVQKLINGLTVYGAYEVWKELNEVFGK